MAIVTDQQTPAAPRDPSGLALADRHEQLTFGELGRRAGSFAAALLDTGLEPGDHVAIDLPAGVDHAVALHGAWLAGAITQSMPPRGREGVAMPDGVRWIEGRMPEVDLKPPDLPQRDPRSPLTRVLTSGTSGEPKAVELTLANHLASARASAERLGVEPADRWLCCLPLNHVGGLSILIRSAIYGTAAVIEDGFDVEPVATLMGAGEATIVSLVPTQLVRLLDADAPLHRPRLLLVGGGLLPLDVLTEALRRGATVVQTYGLTEACSQVCTLAPEEAGNRPGSAGRPLAGIEVRIEDAEILVRGPTVAPGVLAADGWLHTGDLGRIDDDGYLWVEGRRDDLIVTGGENVRPERVEGVLREHATVADVAVIGVEDREWGQAVTAFVVARDGEPPEAELLALARARLSPPEVPKRFVTIDELPRTASGKLLRRKLADHRS